MRIPDGRVMIPALRSTLFQETLRLMKLLEMKGCELMEAAKSVLALQVP